MKTALATPAPTILRHPNFNPAQPTPDVRKPLAPAWQLALARSLFGIGGHLLPRFIARQAYKLLVAPRFKVIRNWQSDIERMATAFTFTSEGLKLQAYQWGEGEQTILLLHGWESRGLTMRKFVLPLLEQGFKVVAFDAPAHGQSEGTEVDYANYGQAIMDLFSQIGPVHSIIGHSMGGITLLFQLAKLIRNQGDLPPDLQQLQKVVVISAPRQIKTTLEKFAKMLWVPNVLIKQMGQLVQERYGYTLEELDTTNWGPKIPIAEALIVHDRYDAVVPFEAATRLHQCWDKSTLLITEGYGHNLIIRDKQVIQHITSFIKG